MTWHRFQFTGVLGTGPCDSVKQWERIRDSYRRHWPTRDLLESRREPGTELFGLGVRFSGEPLGAFATKNGMTL